MSAPPSDASALRETLVFELARGTSWSRALDIARDRHPESIATIDLLATMPESPDPKGRRILFGEFRSASMARTLEIVRNVAWIGAAIANLAAVAMVSVLLRSKILPTLCQAASLSPDDCASARRWLGLAPKVAGLTAMILVVAFFATLSTRAASVSRLVRVAKLASFGVDIAKAIQFVYGPRGASAVTALTLRPDDARHPAAVHWLLASSAALNRLPRSRFHAVIAATGSAVAWGLGALVAGSVYRLIADVGGGPW